MTTMRYRATACAACGNHTVLAATGMCLTCVSESFPPQRRRRLELALIYAAAALIAAAFLLVALSGHVRAQDLSSLTQTPARVIKFEPRVEEPRPFTPPPCLPRLDGFRCTVSGRF